MKLNTLTADQFLTIGCRVWGEAKVHRVIRRKAEEEWTALDILGLQGVSDEDKLELVLREEFIDAQILHEFACQCAESALAGVGDSDPRSLAAVDAKRRWLKGKIDNKELSAARTGAYFARVAGDTTAADVAWAAADTWAIRTAQHTAGWAAAYAATRATKDAKASLGHDAYFTAKVLWTADWDAPWHDVQATATAATRRAQIRSLRELLAAQVG